MMSKTSGLPYGKDAIRVRVKKCLGGLPSDDRKFSIDPEITSFEILQTIVAKAFDIKGDFALSYRVLDDIGQETFLPLLSDWDLDVAVVSASDPYLCINVNAKHAGERSIVPEERCAETSRDVFGTIEIPRTQLPHTKPQTRLPGLIMNRMEKTLNIFQRAFNIGEESAAQPIMPSRPPLADVEFRKFLDPIGQISHMKELRSAIYFGGIEPGLRKVVWKHILNVYPQGMSGRERMDYMKRKTKEYEALREVWRVSLQQGHGSEELAYVTSMVRKDVLRTDRHHKFYAGHDDNQNIASLFNILTTYALNHPSVSYCQGMSDIASPLLVTMADEAHAYICFCALMTRLKPNFMLDGVIMTIKFQHLTEGLMQCDPQFYAYLKIHQAEDLLFCYRWLLLEMKREFAFDEALHMLEVLWSSLEATAPSPELALFEIKFTPLSSPPISPLVRTVRETPYTKVCAIRRQSSSMSLNSISSGRRIKSHRQNQSLDENVIAKQSRLRKQGKMKPFFSLDDNCIELKEGSLYNSQSASAMHNMGEHDPLTLMKLRVNKMKENKNIALSSSTGNLTEATNRRIASKRLIEEKSSSSLNKLQLEKENDSMAKANRGRTIKNLNEFLNLAGRGNSGQNIRQRSQCSSISESDVLGSSNVTIARSRIVSEEAEINSDVESDRSSLKRMSSPSFSSSVSPNVFEAPISDDSSPDACHDPSGVNYGSDSSPDDSTEYCPVTTSMTRELRLELEHLDRNVMGLTQNKTSELKAEPEVFLWENPMRVPTTPDEQGDLDLDNGKVKADEIDPPAEPTFVSDPSEVSNFLARSALTTSNILHSLRTGQILRSPAQAFSALPPPEEFGGGNPFLMFLSLTLLRQHRDFIMSNQMDYNEMAMHFDKMVRKHNVSRVLEEARQMFASYLKQQSPQSSQNSKLNFKV